jgi:hypothetical protein
VFVTVYVGNGTASRGVELKVLCILCLLCLLFFWGGHIRVQSASVCLPLVANHGVFASDCSQGGCRGISVNNTSDSTLVTAVALKVV